MSEEHFLVLGADKQREFHVLLVRGQLPDSVRFGTGFEPVEARTICRSKEVRHLLAIDDTLKHGFIGLGNLVPTPRIFHQYSSGLAQEFSSILIVKQIFHPR